MRPLYRIHRKSQREEQRQVSSLDYRAFFEATPDPCVVLDRERRMIAANDAYVSTSGFSREELLGRGIFDVFPDDRSTQGLTILRASLDRVFSEGVTDVMGVFRYDIPTAAGNFQERYWSPINTPVLGPDGKVAYVVHRARDVTATVLRAQKRVGEGAVIDEVRTRQQQLDAELVSRSGEVDGWVAVVFDISQRKELEEEVSRLNESLAKRVEELEEANRDLDGFNRMVSHDLRQPLNAISTACQAVKMLCGEQVGEKCRGYLDLAYAKVFAMNDLIDSLLTFSRSAHTEVEREKVNLSEVVEEIAADFKLTDPGREVLFQVEKKVCAEGDPSLLRSALENLVGNAWKYTAEREHPVIEFGVRDVAGDRVYFVRDNGKGFAMAQAGDLFVPFKRLAGSDGHHGFGIGLATVDRIVRRHGGRIWAEGAPDLGATFYFTLPPAAEKKKPGDSPGKVAGERRSKAR